MSRTATGATIALLLIVVAQPGAPAAPRVQTWRREGGRIVTEAGGEDTARPVGSLQKPFVAQAWARAHPDRPTPRVDCDGRRCWLRSGHGTLGLSRAVALSCNEYFLALAAETPDVLLRSTLLAEGFEADGAVTAGAAVGLENTIAITPRRVLEAYVRLTRTPWVSGEDVRRQVLSGLRQAALDGTARGLGRRGYWAKTGTVDARGRAGLQTVGWALAVDDSGWAILGRLEPGTGRQAARALGSSIAGGESGPASRESLAAPARSPRTQESWAESVRVHLFALARPRSLVAINRGAAAVSGSRGFVGPGGSVSLRAGDRLGESLWELSLPDHRLLRRLKAALDCEDAGGGTLEVVAEMEPREYVSGVIAAEQPEGQAGQRVALGAAALRFRSQGARHRHADLCDSTHCAWFVGRGPRVRWPTPRRALLERHPLSVLSGAEWVRIVEESRTPGPAQWTSHCGGRPLSAHALWGNGDRRVVSCPLHDATSSRPWTRAWSDEALARAFDGRVSRLEVAASDGTYQLQVTTPQGTQDLLYDEAHARLARVLGWGAMPSPPDRIARAGGGFRAEGVGLGHRVGLCLGVAPAARFARRIP